MHQRTAIVEYVVDMFKANKALPDKVFANRPSPLFIQELPCILVYFTAEPVDIIVGDTYSPKEYQRNLRLNTDIVTDQPIDPGADLNESLEAEKRVDEIAWHIERIMADDYLLSRRLPGFDPNSNPAGLTLGMRLVSTDPYQNDTDGDRRMICQRIGWEVPYETHAYVNKKYKGFNSYQADFLRVGTTEDTVDPVLLSAEGTI